MNIVKSGPVLQGHIILPVLLWLPQTSTDKFTVLTGATVMARMIQVFVQVALLCSLVTNSMGDVTDWQKAFLDKSKINTSEEEGTASEDEGDSSVLSTLGMEPYLFEPVTPINLSGSESASEEDPGEAIWRLANTTWYVLEP